MTKNSQQLYSQVAIGIDVEMELRRRGLNRKVARPKVNGLLDFTVHTHREYLPGWFHKKICSALDSFLLDVVQKKSPRMMIFAPPRHGKSELVSRRFPAHVFGEYPDLSIIGSSYSAALASRMNRDIQRIMSERSYAELYQGTNLCGMRAQDSGQWLRNSEIFEIVNRDGSYRSTGVGGGITGMGADIFIIDDPIKDAQEAHSQTVREGIWDWYSSTAYTRLSPGGGVLIILTRWNEDDLAGRLLAAMEQDGDKWEILSFAALAEQDELPYRKFGEALHPERYSLEQLSSIKLAIGSYYWNALYQQHPAPLEGDIIKRHWWKRVNVVQGNPWITIHSWDTAWEDTEGAAYSCCQKWIKTEFGYFLTWVGRWKMQYPELKQHMKDLYMRDKPSIILVENKASGIAAIQELKREGTMPIVAFPEKGNSLGSKEVRTMANASIIEAGLVHIVGNESWVAEYIDEHAAFPNGTFKDQVDATSQALSYLKDRAGVGTAMALHNVGFSVGKTRAMLYEEEMANEYS